MHYWMDGEPQQQEQQQYMYKNVHNWAMIKRGINIPPFIIVVIM